jgi:T5SS/PEP-CTERM-associated repeat protein
MRQTQRQFPMMVLLICAGVGIRPAVAQYTANYQTNLISGVTSNWPGNYMVGSNTFADALLIQNGGVLSTSDGYVGYQPASSSNFVRVAGSGSVWSNASLHVGFSGCKNKMIVNGGGRVYCAYYGTIGSSASSCSNTVWISDTDSLWDVSSEAIELRVGWSGSGNMLVVTNGGQFKGYYAYLGHNACSNNSALVTGPGSGFAVNCYVYIGNQGHDNTFTVANGGTVSDKFCYISYAAGSSNNAVLVTGTNSTWQNSYGVVVGFDGGAGSLTISNGATMSSGGAWTPSHNGIIGYNLTSSNNRAVITGSNSVWSCAEDVYVGIDGPANSLVINNGGRVINREGLVGLDSGSDRNSVLVTGTNSVWTNSSYLYLGNYGVSNSLMISSGGRVTDTDGLIGFYSNSSNNWVLVTGGGSVWSNTGALKIGYGGIGNSLVISNKARVISNFGIVGQMPGSDDNRVLVAGTNSVWADSYHIHVGDYGSGNSLVITNGGRVSADWGLLGNDTNSVNNQALVTGAGSVWSNSTVTFVGYSGSSNRLVIREGGLVTGYYGILGQDYSSWDNYACVEPGGVWRSEELLVGDGGSHNALFVEGGSVFVNSYMCVGYAPDYYNNLVEMLDGQIIVTNQTYSGVLEVYGGGLLLAGGTLLADTIIATNEGAQFMYIGGNLGYRNLVLTPEFDVDSDGIPNGWEQAHGLEPLNPDDAAADNDGDGMSNLAEYQAGTNPTNAASCFTITSLALTNGNVRVRWSAVGGKHYVLQTNAAPGADFADASPVIAVPGTGEMVTNYLDPGAATNGQTRFYRIRLDP